MVKSRRLGYCLIFLVGALVFYWSYLAMAWNRTSPITLNVSAFKSHHWLYGEHYLYRVLVDNKKSGSCLAEDTYVCLNPIAYSSKPFDDSCTYEMRGICRMDNHFVTHASRFYIPADKTQQKGQFYHQRGKITLLVSKMGPVFVKDFTFG